MTENRRRAFTEEELITIADLLAERMKTPSACRLTEEQQKAVVELITAKKKAVKMFLWLIGAMCLWVLKDVYSYIVSHITFIGVGK